MKEKLRRRARLGAWFYTQAPLIITRPALGEALSCGGYLAGGFLLSAARLGEGACGFAPGLVASAGGGLRGLCCMAGAAAGYFLTQPFDQALELASAGVLTYVILYIFRSLWISRRSWLPCVAAGSMTAAVGLIFLLSQTVTPVRAAVFGSRVLTAALSPLCYRQLRQGRRELGTRIALGSLILGAARIPLPWGLDMGLIGAIALTGAAAGRGSLDGGAGMAVAAGAALELSGHPGALLTLGLSGAAAAGLLPRRGAPRFLIFGGMALALSLLTGSLRVALALNLLLGLGGGFVLPEGLLADRERGALERERALAAARLREGNEVLLRLHGALELPPRQAVQRANRVFDGAAEQVCAQCSRFSLCWQQEARETYELLSPVLPGLLRRGEARKEDFPAAFTDRCRQLDGFLLAVNRELEQQRSRTPLDHRRREERAVAAGLLLHLARLLERNARMLRCALPETGQAYRVRLGVSARGRGASRLSGDRGAAFHTEDGRYVVILCDGAGTGTPAAAESALAVESLTDLIRAGMPPESAMELLNDIYLLRDSGSFSTMDILEVSLLTGKGTLYKWGAAPSYFLSQGNLRRLGTPAPPPGLGVEEPLGPEILDLTLWTGDLLVMVSDGAADEGAEALIRGYGGGSVRALAGDLVRQAVENGAQDDMTAVVLSLSETETKHFRTGP